MATIVLVASMMSNSKVAQPTEAISEEAYARCRAIANSDARLRCFENLVPQSPSMGSPNPVDPTFGSPPAASSLPVTGKWRLVRTPDGRNGQDVVSVMTPAELAGSDIDFAGIGLRCANPDFSVFLFLVKPMPPRATPAISINGKSFQGSVLSPGTSVLLPSPASQFVEQEGRSLPNLSIDVSNSGTKIHGLVSLDGFAAALQTLNVSCKSQ